MKKVTFVTLAGLAILNVVSGESKMPNLDNKIQEMKEYNQKTLDWMEKAEAFDPARWEKIEKDTYKRYFERKNPDQYKEKQRRQLALLSLESSVYCDVKDRFLKEKGWGIENSPKKDELKKYWDYISKKCFSAEKKRKEFLKILRSNTR